MDAVTASCSIPIIFSPVVINGVHYVDGGLFHNFPVSIIRDMCERVIGVNVSPLVPQKYKQTIFHIAERSYHYMFRANTLEDREMCDVLIEAEEFGMYKTFDLENVEQIARIGYDAAIRAFELVIQENKYETLVNENDANLVNAINFIDQTKTDEKPTEEKVVPQLTNEEQKTQSQRRLIKSLLWIGAIVGLALLGYIIYQSAMLLM